MQSIRLHISSKVCFWVRVWYRKCLCNQHFSAKVFVFFFFPLSKVGITSVLRRHSDHYSRTCQWSAPTNGQHPTWPAAGPEGCLTPMELNKNRFTYAVNSDVQARYYNSNFLESGCPLWIWNSQFTVRVPSIRYGEHHRLEIQKAPFCVVKVVELGNWKE